MIWETYIVCKFQDVEVFLVWPIFPQNTSYNIGCWRFHVQYYNILIVVWCPCVLNFSDAIMNSVFSPFQQRCHFKCYNLISINSCYFSDFFLLYILAEQSKCIINSTPKALSYHRINYLYTKLKLIIAESRINCKF